MRKYKSKYLVLCCLVVILATVLPAGAGGPLIIFDPATRTPFAWPGPISVFTDNDPLFSLTGPVTNADADARVADGLAQWAGVTTATLSGVVAGDFASIALPDINLGNVALVLNTFNGGGYHIIYDHDGAIIAALAGPGVLGFSGPEFVTTGTPDIVESVAVLNGATVDVGDVLATAWQGVFTHEMGHGFNLAHTQTNGAIGFFLDDIAPAGCVAPYTGFPLISDLETMYPFLDPSIGGSGVEQGTVDLLDDRAAVSNVYPAPGWPASSGTITGKVFLSDGLTEITGVNVIVRNVLNPFGDCSSALSGDFTQGDLGPDGLFTFNGLTPGAEYVVYIDQIVAGGFSTPPVLLPGPEEFFNAAESSDPNLDDVCASTSIFPVAGAPFTADIIFNQGIFLGDDDFLEVDLPFPFPFCETTYTSVFVGSNGFLTFGVGNTDFSESVADFLGGPPRIAPLWDDLNPAAGGTITADLVAGEFVIAYDGIPEFPATGSNTFSVALRPDGTFRVDYGALTLTDGLVGRTNGGGQPDPGETDLSAALPPIGTGADAVYEIFTLADNDLTGLGLDFDTCTPFVFVADPADPGVCYASTGLGGSNPGHLLTIDVTTGAATIVGSTGQSRVPAIAINSAGEMFGSNGGGGSDLIRISASNGASQVIAPFFDAATGFSLSFVDALAFDENDVLFGIDVGNDFWTIDTTTGAATLVGNTGVLSAPFLVGLAFHPGTGTFFSSTGGLGAADQIYEIDPATGVATLIGNTGLGGGAIPDLHTVGGTLFAVKNPGGGAPFNLITVDIGTGAGTVVGSTGFRSVSGLASFVPAPAIVAGVLDIQPGKCPNMIRLREEEPEDDSGGGQGIRRGAQVEVAIPGNGEFRVARLDFSTIQLEGVSPIRSRVKDALSIDCPDCRCTLGGEDFSDRCTCTCGSRDGFDDLFLEFSLIDLIAAASPITVGELRTLTLTANLVNGTPFEASDCAIFIAPDENDSVHPITLTSLMGASPNPFNPVTRIRYSLRTADHVRLFIYDVQGRLVDKLVDGPRPAGEHAVEWDAKRVASGVYFYRLQAGGITDTRKLILLK